MTSERTCFVYIMLPGQTEFVTAGRFTLIPTADGQAVGHFVYGRKYLARPDRVEIDPVELKLSDRPFETAIQGGFFGAIRDAMPDSWGRRLIEKRSGYPQLDEFGYGPRDCQGARQRRCISLQTAGHTSDIQY